MTYSIRSADLEAEAAVFLEVLGRNLRHSPQETGRERFRWLYLDNPAGRGAAYLSSVVGADGQRQVVGCTGLGLRRFVNGERPLRAALLADFAVDAPHRTLQPALRLQRVAHEWVDAAAEISYAFPNRHAVGVFRRLGYHEGRFARYVRVLRHEPYVARVVPSAVAAAVGGALLDGALKVRDRWGQKRAATDLQLTWLREPDERFDRLFEEARRSYRLLGERGAAFLRWRFAQRAGAPAELVALAPPDGSRLHAYAAVVTPEPGVAVLEDILGATPQDLSLLLEPLLRELQDRGFRSASLEFAGDPRIKEVLAAHTFMERDARAVVMAPARDFTGDRGVLKDAAAWYLTGADTDT